MGKTCSKCLYDDPPCDLIQIPVPPSKKNALREDVILISKYNILILNLDKILDGLQSFISTYTDLVLEDICSGKTNPAQNKIAYILLAEKFFRFLTIKKSALNFKVSKLRDSMTNGDQDATDRVRRKSNIGYNRIFSTVEKVFQDIFEMQRAYKLDEEAWEDASLLKLFKNHYHFQNQKLAIGGENCSPDMLKDNENSLPRTSDQDPLKKLCHKASMDRTKSSAGLTTGGDTVEIHWDKKPSSHLKKCQSDLFFNLYDDDSGLMPSISNIFFCP